MFTEREIRIGGLSGGLGAIIFAIGGGPVAALIALGAGIVAGQKMFPEGEKPWRDLAGLLGEGEHGRLEFKRQFLGGKNEPFSSGIMKAIAGLANAEGGEVLIGIDDGGKVIGVDSEVNKYGGKDRLEAAFRNAIKNALNTDSSGIYRLRFEAYQGALLCRVEVFKSKVRIFVGPKGEFFKREGNLTRAFSAREYHDMQQKVEG